MSVLVKLWKREIESIEGRIARVYSLKNRLKDSLIHETRVEEQMRVERIIEGHEQTIRECQEEVYKLERQIREAEGISDEDWQFDLDRDKPIINAEEWARALVFIRAEWCRTFRQLIGNLENFNAHGRKGELEIIMPNLPRQVILFLIRKYGYFLTEISGREGDFLYLVEYREGTEDPYFIRNIRKIIAKAADEYFGK